MKIRALTRFNYHDVNDEWDEKKENAELWIDEGLAEKAGKKEKTGPDNDKTVKKDEVVTK